jgi:hypothetical protein
MYRSFLLLPIFFITINAFSQIRFSGEATIGALISTGEKLPFWMYHNKRGRLSENTNISGWVTGRGEYDLSTSTFLEVGGGLLYQDGISDQLFIDEIYAHIESEKLYFTVGRKQQKELYNGLSVSNRSILWSLNARPLPGIQIGTNGPLFPFDPDNATGFGFEGSWNEYVMEKDRHVSYAKLHHKNLLLVYKTRNNFEVKAGLQHFVQWGGASKSEGQQPESFKDYLRVIGGKSGDEFARDSDFQNALGNHLGGYEIFVKKSFRDFSLELIYNHLFEDGSGRRLGNTPDGRYGVFLETKDKGRIINSVIYELYYTHHQSNTTTGIHKFDDYLNNSGYRSGWTYENRVLGAPFFTVDPDGEGIINNKFLAHHLGIGGQISNSFASYPYKVLLSYARNDGRYPRRFRPKQDVAYIYSEFGLMRSWIHLDLQFGAEYNSYASPTYGVGVQARYRF